MGKSRLSAKELTGLLFLGLIIGIVIVCSLLLKRCDTVPEGGGQSGPQVETPANTSDDSDYEPSRRKSKGKKSKKKGSKKGGGRKGGSKKEKAAVPVRDPFSDTIPTDY